MQKIRCALVLLVFLALPTMAAAQNDVVIAQTKPAVCDPQGTTPYLSYNTSDGKWHCAANPLDLTKTVSRISNATATTLLTVTVPNATIGAVLHVRVLGSLGAGGTIGAFECAAALEGNVIVTRTAGVLAVVNASTAAQTANACVAGATTITLSYAASSVSGGATGTDSFTITGTISRGDVSGGPNLHQAVVIVSLANNSNATALTVR